MKYTQINSKLFIENRARLAKLMLPNSLAVLNSNDTLPTNADGTLLLLQNADLFYLTGIEQEESMLLFYPHAHDKPNREILFLRKPDPLTETWEGRKLTKEDAKKISGIARVEWLCEFKPAFHRLMCESEHVYLNTNEHKRADVVVETRDARFVQDVMRQYPLHDYKRLAQLMHQLRAVKSDVEVDLLRHACDITRAGFRRVCKFTKPGVNEMEIEAEFAHEFIRRGGQFAYPPIIASGANACALHYHANEQICRDGDLLLLDVAAGYANYKSDLTRTIPVNGKFTKRQRQVYEAVLRSMRACSKAATPGKLHGEWNKEAQQIVEKELVDLKLLKPASRRKAGDRVLADYFMHGVGHLLGLDVHDVGLLTEPIEEGWVLTVEPGIYIKEEGIGVRLENNILVKRDGNVDLMESIPIEADEIEELMSGKQARRRR